MVLAPPALVEPVWSDLLPGDDAEQRRVRQVAAALWVRCAPVLASSVGLVSVQQEVLADYCLTYARIDQGEHVRSRVTGC